MSQQLSQAAIIDGHVHLMSIRQAERLLEIRQCLGFGRMNLLSIVDPRRGNGNSTVLAAKALHPEAFYAFGGLDHAAVSNPANPVPLARQAQRLWQTGCDGIKMLETKPNTRRELNVPVDGPYYEEYFALVEEQKTPLLWHVADPEEFWDPRTTPWWAAKHNWGYGPSDVPKETLHAEVARVLDRHAGLKVIFAHFYFLSADIPRLVRFLLAYPNVSIDLALGVEMLLNLSKAPDQAREFFVQHQDRIVFGTDIADGLTVEHARIRTELIRRFIETDDTYAVPPDAEELLQTPGRIRGLALPGSVLKKIYADNFARTVGRNPRPLDRGRVIEECRRQASQASRLAGVPAEQTEAGQCIKALES
ncbi:MAG: amidohydrolase family protein [Phycisphaerae bacterium]|nr:amidohydrolase family protein [Phycisphaerae bacterium]